VIRGRSTIFVAPQIPVGAGLPAKASARSTSSSPDPPLSRAGSLPQWSGANLRSLSHPKSLWERACPRRRRHVQPHHRLTHRFREQARSHNSPGQGHNLQPNPNPCGSEPAREEARSDTSTLNDTPLSRAGSLPQWSGARSQSSAQPKSLWERACPRRRRHIQHRPCLTHRFREQARSHRECR